MKQMSRLMIIEIRLIANVREVRAAETIFVINNENSLVRAVVLAILLSINVAI